ncbi:MAG: histidine--tRNA ligase [Rickettsiales bacterium]
MSNLQPARGTKDLLFKEQEEFTHIVSLARHVSSLFGYSEMSTPIFEFTEVFKRTLGDFSDIVNKEMYTFEDRKGQSLTLRPEFTASVMRSVISNGLYNKLPLKLFSWGPLFRYERPQKGRMRQFHQINCEYIGSPKAVADIEVISLAHLLLDRLGVLDKVRLEINSLGDFNSRSLYIEKLVDYYSKYKNDLSEDSRLRFDRNPLRILDSKDSGDKKINQSAPKLEEHLNKESKRFFEEVLSGLDALGIKYYQNHSMVRGLDYYNHTAFEFITEELGAQGTVLAGGRYDGLIKTMGGKDSPGVGFAAGIERLVELADIKVSRNQLVSIIVTNPEYEHDAMKLSSQLRRNEISVEIEEQNNPAKALKKAIERGAGLVVYFDNRVALESCIVKNLKDRSEERVEFQGLVNFVKSNEF